MRKILTTIFLTLFVTFGILGCNVDIEEPDRIPTTPTVKPTFSDSYGKDDTWLIYWYVCGSNLESDGGAATIDIQEMMRVPVPANVKVLLQAGGSKIWRNAVVRSDMTNRFLYDSEGLHVLEVVDDADMGSPDTLASFLRYGEDNFNADHRVFIFWDHGGGSAFGVCHDERTNNILDLNEIHDAFASVFDNSIENPAFEIVGFDTCLMATYEMANDLYGFARYMVASEETEPGGGWEYTGLLTALSENPAMGGDSFGKAICDTYYEGCRATWTAGTATLSVVDLSKIPQLRTAYENFGIEALKLSSQNPRSFFANLGRNAIRSENYGGNTREQGYYDMIDLGDLARKSRKLLPASSDNLITAIDDAVVYKINGMYRDKGSGISGFYPYDGGTRIFDLYSQVYSAPQSHKYLYRYLLYGSMPPEAIELIQNAEIASVAETENLFDIDDLEDLKIQVDDKNNAYVKLTKEQMENLSRIVCNLAYVDEVNDVILYLGSDTGVKIDWEQGTCTDNFDGRWLMLDGHPVYIEVTAEEDAYNLYSVPIRLNDVRCNLEIAYDRNDKEYKILGARRPGVDGMADKNLIRLQAGDVITTLHYGLSLSGEDDEFLEVDVDTFTVDDNPKFDSEIIGDGEYLYCFEFVTPNNESATSEFINFTIRDRLIYTSELQ